jgi:hypothetical protein
VNTRGLWYLKVDESDFSFAYPRYFAYSTILWSLKKILSLNISNYEKFMHRILSTSKLKQQLALEGSHR